jgi:CsoR family transcriptional regulator, copper-sensing transcriptional repressor
MLDQSIKNKAVRRARIIEGQVRALASAIESEEYCIDLLIQSRAIQNSLKSLDQILLENHLKGHVKHMLNDKNQEGKAVKELVELFALSTK